MRVDRINYQKTFNLGNYTSERIGLEAELEGGDDAEFQLANLKKAVEDLHKATNPGLYIEVNPEYSNAFGQTGAIKSPPPYQNTMSTIQSIDRNAIDRLEKLIDDCDSLAQLSTYESEAERYGLKDLLNSKAKELKVLSK